MSSNKCLQRSCCGIKENYDPLNNWFTDRNQGKVEETTKTCAVQDSCNITYKTRWQTSQVHLNSSSLKQHEAIIDAIQF